MLVWEGGSGSQNEEGDAGCGAGGTGWVRAGELIREGHAWCSPFHSACCDVEICDIHTEIHINIYIHANVYVIIIEE